MDSALSTGSPRRRVDHDVSLLRRSDRSCTVVVRCTAVFGWIGCTRSPDDDDGYDNFGCRHKQEEKESALEKKNSSTNLLQYSNFFAI